MKNTTYLLLFVSAVLYALPFFFVHQLWWLVFFYPIPFLYTATHKTLFFNHGFFWGMCVWALHLSGVIRAVVGMAHGNTVLAIGAAIAVVLYQALFVGIIFWLAQNCAYLIPHKSFEKELLIWTSALFIYTYWADRWCMFAFGRGEGYQLMHPLIPLAKYPPLLSLLPIIGKHALTILFFVLAASIVYAIVRRTMFAYGLCALALLPWVVSVVRAQPEQPEPAWVEKIITLPTIFSPTENKQAMIRAAGDEFAYVVHEQPHTELIVMPESSFYADDLAHRNETEDLWNEQYVGKNINAIIGAFRTENDNFYNTIYWYKNGKLQSLFDKRHTMMLTERIPSLFNVSALRTMYFHDLPQRCVGCNKREPLALLDEQSFVPYVCSELFFNEQPDDNNPELPIMFVSNDMWFDRMGARYVQDLMEVGAQYKAIAWQRDIVYTSASRMRFVSR